MTTSNYHSCHSDSVYPRPDANVYSDQGPGTREKSRGEDILRTSSVPGSGPVKNASIPWRTGVRRREVLYTCSAQLPRNEASRRIERRSWVDHFPLSRPLCISWSLSYLHLIRGTSPLPLRAVHRTSNRFGIHVVSASKDKRNKRAVSLQKGAQLITARGRDW